MNEYIMVFKNTHDAIGAERFIKGRGLAITVIPTPSYITQSCGISIKFGEEVIDKIKDLLGFEISYKNIYLMEKSGLKMYM